MTTQLRIQVASFSLAALVTLATLVGLNSLAQGSQDSAQLAKAVATQAA